MSTRVVIDNKDLANELELLVDDRIQFIQKNIHRNPGPLGESLVLLKEFHTKLQLMQRAKPAPEWIEDGGIVNKKDD